MIARYCPQYFVIMNLWENSLISHHLQAIFLNLKDKLFFILP